MNDEGPLDIMCVPRVVNYHNGECLVSGEEIPKMKYSLELCQTYYQSFAQSVCLSMRGLKELEKLINEDFSIRELNSIEIKRKVSNLQQNVFYAHVTKL